MPPLRYYLEKVLHDMDAVSRTGPLRSQHWEALNYAAEELKNDSKIIEAALRKGDATALTVPLACLRIGSGPPARNLQGQQNRPSPQKIRKEETGLFSGVAPANQTKERPVHELFPGAFRNKSSICEFRFFSQGKTPESTKMGEMGNS